MPLKGGYVPSGIVSWNTPEPVLKLVRKVLGTIHLDPCSNDSSTVRAEVEYRLPRHDGLMETWDYPTIFVNPPFGAGIDDWIKRCCAARDHGSDVLLLIPCWMETAVWSKVIFPRAEALCVLSGRVLYLLNGHLPENSPPMGSAIVLWSKRQRTLKKFIDVFREAGAVMVSERCGLWRMLMREHGGRA